MRAAVLLLLLLPACAGARAREHVLLPAMQVAFRGIAEDAMRADPTVRGAVERMRRALQDGDVRTLRREWPGIRGAAQRGARGRPLGVAASALERIRLFDQAVRKL